MSKQIDFYECDDCSKEFEYDMMKFIIGSKGEELWICKLCYYAAVTETLFNKIKKENYK